MRCLLDYISILYYCTEINGAIELKINVMKNGNYTLSLRLLCFAQIREYVKYNVISSIYVTLDITILTVH